MEKFADFILRKRNRLFGGLLIFTVISLFLATLVDVNSDMTEYLPEDSNLKTGLAVMEEEFGHLETSENLHIMFEDLTEVEMTAIYEQLSSMPDVVAIAFDMNSESHVIDEFTLYTLTLEAGMSSDEEYAFVQTLIDAFDDFSFVLSGNVEGVLPLVDMMLIIVPTVIILVIIFFIMCRSWFEPIIFFINIGIAILINTGTNELFNHISEPSDMIASVLQVALSMDYAIIFLNRYRREKATLIAEGIHDIQLAMKNTIVNSFSAVSGIAFTTILGMLMLVFMSFTIGADIGLIIAKSVFISLICVFGVMPALILRFDKVIEKTSKPALSLKMRAAGSFCHRTRYLVTALFILLFAGAFIAQNHIEITYSELEFDPIHQTFEIDNYFVLLYENDESDQIESVMDYLIEQDAVMQVQAYANSLGMSLNDEEMTAHLSEMSDYLEMDELLISLVYRNYFLEELPQLSLDAFLVFLGDLTEIPMLAELLPMEDLEALFTLQAVLAGELPPGFELDPESGLPIDPISGLPLQPQIDLATGMPTGLLVHPTTQQVMQPELDLITGEPTGNFLDPVSWLPVDPFTGQLIAPQADGMPTLPLGFEEYAELIALLADPELMAVPLNAEQIAEILDMEVAMIEQSLYLYDVIHGQPIVDEMKLPQFIDYVLDIFATMPLFEPMFTEDLLQILTASRDDINLVTDFLIGPNFSRLMIITSLPIETDETFIFLDEFYEVLNERLVGEFYLLGESMMPYELSQTFPDESRFITLLTTLAFFLVVTVSFKSMSVAIVLAIVIQGSVFIAMAATVFLDVNLSFLDVVIVQAILKSRVIDYGILYISNYVEARKTFDIKQAIVTALNHSMDTILTSGLIMVLVTLICGFVFMGISTSVAQILFLVAQGCFIGVLLSVFVLPSLIAVFDRFIIKKKKEITTEN